MQRCADESVREDKQAVGIKAVSSIYTGTSAGKNIYRIRCYQKSTLELADIGE